MKFDVLYYNNSLVWKIVAELSSNDTTVGGKEYVHYVDDNLIIRVSLFKISF